ncbi:hypothetical protein CUR178_01489 [Leishmania enriettii]|uniref:IQ calmodulin-binding motif family protein n=1 Tax=Leishmania enriettii TaxID=5663 RepID=A0A836H1I3_LEIEN|nr:hypothetical protein CUR178_01489 [Leishmania enriettii]
MPVKGASRPGLHCSGDARSRSRGTSAMQRSHNRSRLSRHNAASPSSMPGATVVPPTARQLQHAPLVAFTQWNEAAMEALRSGDSDSSRRILSVLLPVLEARLHAMQCKPSARTCAAAIDSWLLVHALTLNNYGCQLRRDGRTDEALRQFLRAKQVETPVFGKPSCSTMLNLSAVLLSTGAVEEALNISKECVMAAQDAEPILFITALHNLAVALGQQTSERERKAALPTMLQALREAQSALGEQHSTTLMLKEKCGFTFSWISQNSEAEAGKGGGVSGPAVQGTSYDGSAAKPASSASVRTLEKARAALHTLDFGEPAHAQPVVRAVAAVEASGLAHSPPSGKKEEVYAVPVSQHPLKANARREHRAASAAHDAQDLLCSVPQESARPHPVAHADGERAAPVTMTLGETASSPATSRQSSVAASVEHLCLDSANLSGTQHSVGSTPLETVLEEPFRTSSLVINRSVPDFVGPAGAIRSLYRLDTENGGKGPTFLRFSVPPPLPVTKTISPPLRKIAPPVVSTGTWSTLDTTDKRRHTKAWQAAVSQGTHESSDGSNRKDSDAFARTAVLPTGGILRPVDKEEKPVAATGGLAAVPPALQRSIFCNKGLLHSGRTARREVELQEERAYRAQMEAEKKAAEAENAFQRALEEVQRRTQNRAAVTIQHVWRQWWNAKGRSRRLVQLQRLEELQRRRRERMVLGAVTGKKSSRSWKDTVPPPPSQQHGHVGGYVVPAVVLRCAKKWLLRTTCVRYVARSHRKPVDARLREADVLRLTCRIQALWRGAIARHRRAPGQQLSIEHADANAAYAAYRLRAEAELCEYSALVLQMAYRSYRARQRRRRLYLEQHSRPATTIQRWLRATLADQRRRGVDSRTVCKRDAAALTVQRSWRGYLGRVTFRMLELRLRMDRVGSCPLAIVGRVGAGRSLTATEGRKERDVEYISTDKNKAPGAVAVKKVEKPPPAAKADARALGRAALESKGAAAFTEAYTADCLRRSSEVQRWRDEERDRFHIGLYVDAMATKERLSWEESLRLRPTEVLRRRLVMDMQMQEEQRVFTERRAALTIQRAYRQWRKMRDDPNRDTNMLVYSRALYQQRELASLTERKQRRVEIARGTALYGDSAAVMRDERAKAAKELALMVDGEAPAKSTRSHNEIIGVPREVAVPAASYAERRVRNQLRRKQEAHQRRDEVLVALTYPHDMAHVREGPHECAIRIGTTYEHPYYVPYVNEEHRRTLGID